MQARPRDREASPGVGRRARSSTEYSRAEGKKPPFIRSACTRNISTASAAGSSASRSWDTVTGQSATPTGSSVGGATSTTSAPRVASSMTLERATRLCRMSPTMTTRRPSMSPSRCRMVSASSNACVGCSWVPSPALITDGPVLQPSQRGPVGKPVRRTGSRVPDDQRVGAGGPQGQRGVAQRFAFAHRRSRGADVDHVGAHPLAGDLERHPGAGGVLVEHRDHRAAAQRRQLADLAARPGPARTGRRRRGSRWPRRGTGRRRPAGACS